MNFQRLPKLEKYTFYLDVAIKRGKERAAQLPKRREEKLLRAKRKSGMFITTTGKVLQGKLTGIVKSYPSFNELPDFYKELIRVTLDLPDIRQALGALQWAATAITDFTEQYARKVKGSRTYADARRHQQAYLGRISSVVKQVKNAFEIIEHARRIMKQYPDVKELPTVVIAGYPNVGKTTLLKALTNSAPKIASYPFTTLRPMLGSYSYRSITYQVMDTPGMLDRPLKQMNKAEKQAVLALRHLSGVVIFIVDATEQCGYTLREQLSLLQQTKQQFKQPFITVANKIDISSPVKQALNISAEKKKGIAMLRQRVAAAFQQA